MSTESRRIRVLIADDHSIMREGLQVMLERFGEFEVVGQAKDGVEAVKAAYELSPDVIIMDIMMPKKDGVEACREIKESLPDTRVVMLTASNETDTVIEAVAAGATGYLQKVSGMDQFLTTLREVAEGEFRIPGNAASRLAQAVRSPLSHPTSEQSESLTDREKEILKLFAEGLTYQEIGDTRNNSALTVRNAVSGVQKKLGFKTRQQMVIWAVRNGLVDGGSG